MDYNSSRDKLILKEYGRHVQKIVENCVKEKDDVKAAEYFNKSKALDPADTQADFYFKQKAGTKSK